MILFQRDCCSPIDTNSLACLYEASLRTPVHLSENGTPVDCWKLEQPMLQKLGLHCSYITLDKRHPIEFKAIWASVKYDIMNFKNSPCS